MAQRTAEDRRITRSAWQSLAFPAIDRDNIEGWIATIQAQQAATGAADEVRDMAGTAVLLSKLRANEVDKSYVNTLMLTPNLTWEEVCRRLRADFAAFAGIRVVEDMINVRQGDRSLDNYTDRLVEQLRTMGLDAMELGSVYPPRLLAVPAAAGGAAAAQAAPDVHHERAGRFSRAVFLLVRSVYERGLASDDLRNRVREIDCDNLHEYLQQARRRARGLGIDPREPRRGGGGGGGGGSPPRLPRDDDQRQRRQDGQQRDQRGRGERGRGQRDRQDAGEQRDRGRRGYRGGRNGGGRGPDNSGDRDLSKVQCYSCNQYGHVSRQCPNRDNRGGGAGVGANALMPASVVDKGVPVYKATINGKLARVLVDSGASIDAVSPDWVNQHKFDVHKGDKVHGTTWDGAVLEADSYFEGVFQANELDAPIRLAVMPCPKGCDVVLGAGWQRQHNLIINWQSSRLTSLSRLVFSGDDKVVINKDILSALKKEDSDSVDKDDAATRTAALVERYPHLFKERLDELPPHRPGFDFDIDLHPGAILRPASAYRFTPPKLEALQVILKPLLASGIVVEVQDPHQHAYCPAFLVPKRDAADGTKRYRMVLDARALNAASKSLAYTPQLIDEQIRRIGGAKVLSRIDFCDAFHQIRATEATTRLLSFALPGRVYKFNCMIQGAKNSSAVLNRFVEYAFRDMLGVSLCAYADDLVVYSDTMEDHVQHLRQFLDTCDRHQLRVSASKSEFFVDTCTFLGFKVGMGQIDPLAERLAPLVTYPAPKDRYELRRFLGAVAFYREHFPRLALESAPMHVLTADTKPFTWSAEAQRAFERVRELMANPQTLAQPDPKLPYEIYTDASVQGFAAVIVQNGRPLAYVSKAATAAQAAWPTAELEIYAVKHCLQHYRHWLGGANIVVYTDHQSLTHLATVVASKRLIRHYADIAEFGVTFKYLAGESNQLSDWLSRDPRFPAHDPDAQPMQQFFRRVMNSGEAKASPIMDAELEGGEEREPPDVLLLSSLSLSPAVSLLPSDDLVKLIAHDLRGDAGWAEQWKTVEAAEASGKVDDHYYSHFGLLWRRGAPGLPDRIVLTQGPGLLAVMHMHHDENAHLGTRRLTALLSERYFVKGLNQLVNRYVSSCTICQQAKISNQLPGGEPHAHAVPEEPWAEISTDYLTGLPASGDAKYDAILVVVDKFTRRICLIPAHKTDTARDAAIHLLVHVAAPYGPFQRITSDRGPQFAAAVFRTIWDRLNVNQALTTANYARSNGLAERYVRATLEALRVGLQTSDEDWHELLPFIAMSLNGARHTVHGETPFTADTGRRRATFYDTLLPTVADDLSHRELQRILRHLIRDASLRARELRNEVMSKTRNDAIKYKAGDKVMVSCQALVDPDERERQLPKLRGLRTGPYVIKKMVGQNAAQLELPQSFRAHSTISVWHLRHYVEDPDMHPDSNDEPAIFSNSDGDFYAVERIVGHQYVAGRIRFNVKWVGYGEDHNSWLQPKEFYTRRHIADYCKTAGLAVPPGTPAARPKKGRV